MSKAVVTRADRDKALGALSRRLRARLRTHLNSCVHCGLCAQSCHYYKRYSEPRFVPGNKVDQIGRIYRRYFTLLGRLAPSWVGAEPLDDRTVEEMTDVIFGGCSMCGRCTVHCSFGVDVPFLVRTARTVLAEMGIVPKGLRSTVDTAVETGNNMAIPREELIDTLKWLEDDLRLEVKDEAASIPLDARDKRILYTLNPREPKFFPLSVSAVARIFHAAGESWTISTRAYDVTNYAYFSGEDDTAATLASRLSKEAIDLGAEVLGLAECGHGFRVMRWEAPSLTGTAHPFRTMSVIEIIADYVRSGRLELDPARNAKPVTLHDPCNLVRAGGVMEEQRYVLGHAVADFIEMHPNRADNFCCGGGGGQLAMSEYRDRRVEVGAVKADQIRKTGAKVVATPCHNCIDQLLELNQVYGLGVEVKTVAELVADAVKAGEEPHHQEPHRSRAHRS